MKTTIRKKHAINNVSRCICIALVLACVLFWPAVGAAKRGLPDDIVETSCGADNSDGTRVLIVVGTKYGRTFEIAEEIGEILCTDGYQVDIFFVGNVSSDDLASYGAVIVGSHIYIEAWHEDILAFLEKNESVLGEKSVAYYCVNALEGMDFEDAAELVQEHYIDPMYDAYPEISPLDVKSFAGAINYRILLPKDWIMLRMMFMPGGDWTDWDEVVKWADEMSGQME